MTSTLPPASPAAGAPAAQRPVGVTLLAALATVGAVLAVLGGGFLLLAGAFVAAFVPEDAWPWAAVGAAVLGVLVLFAFGYALVLGILAYGLFARRRWAWYVAVAVAGIQATLSLVAVLLGEVFVNLATLLVAGFVVWYLLSPGVQAWFGVSHRPPWTYGS